MLTLFELTEPCRVSADGIGSDNVVRGSMLDAKCCSGREGRRKSWLVEVSDGRCCKRCFNLFVNTFANFVFFFGFVICF